MRTLALWVLALPGTAAAQELLHMEFNDPADPFRDTGILHHTMTNTSFTEDLITGGGVMLDPTMPSPAGGTAAWFDGGSALDFAASPAAGWDTGHGVTVRLWFRTPGIQRTPAYGRYANRMDLIGFASTAGGSDNFTVDFDDSDGDVGLWTYWNGNGGNAIHTGNNTLGYASDDQWYEYRFVWDGMTAYSYLRPETGTWRLIGTATWATGIGGSTSPNRIGASQFGDKEFGYYGWLDSLIVVAGAWHPDLCPSTPAYDTDDADGDLIGDACDVCLGDNSAGDSDGDRRCDDMDNCPTVANPGQTDFDGDGMGDGCETDLHLTTTGSCPGGMTATMAHLTPGGQVAVVRAAAPGSMTIPSGACAGATVGLAPPASLVAMLPGPPGGSSSRTYNLGPAPCGSWVVIVDMATCRTSPASQLP